ncbi:hypothetical protein HU200_008859 [Digitaria exilis]|uniref:Cytochrome P450 n=1 Tax=Digitaria exilis TaxID=1010633 RepID=A0A835FL51_9POAL|nr:hypothetical protein HU200_008859 [Digitaria exilis]
MILQRRRTLHKNGPALPPVVSGVSLIASLPTLLSKGLPAVIQGLHKKLGSVFTISFLGLKKVTFLIGPDVTAHFFQAPESEISAADAYKFTVPIFGRGVVFDADLITRSKQISLCLDVIKPMNLRSHVDSMVHEVEGYFAQWGQHGVCDLTHEMEHVILLITNRCLLGKQIRENMFEEVATLIDELFKNGLNLIALFFPYLPIKPHRQRDRARARLGEIIHDTGFVDATYIDGRTMSESEIAGLLVSMVFAGQHTSSNASTWTGACLLRQGASSNTNDYLAAAIDEQKRIMERHGEHLDYGILQEMVTLHCCIKEALRMHPPATLLIRHARKGFNVQTREGNMYGIPKGHTLAICTTVSNKLPYIYKDPDVYDPSRFGPGREETKLVANSRTLPLVLGGMSAWGRTMPTCRSR